MPKVVFTNYSRFTDRETGVEFAPELRNGLYVGVAEVEDPTPYRGREFFEIEDDAKAKTEPKGK